MKQNPNIDIDFLKKMIDKGFTNEEVADYFKLKLKTIQYYVRTRNLGRFKSKPYCSGKKDKEAIDAIENKKLNFTQAGKLLGMSQPHIWKRYHNLKKYEKDKEERFEWLKEQQYVKDVEES